MIPAHAEAGKNTKNAMGNRDVKNVFLWGTFDILHEGHFRLFQEASRLGNLFVIALPDKRMSESKRIIHDENERRKNLLKTGYFKDVFIDALPDLKCFDLTPPDIFCFGYDQDVQWREKIKVYIKNRFPKCKFVILEKYGDTHSSDLREAIKCPCGSGKKYKKCHGA
jgi:cytidyltransferase-like protein